VTRGPFRAVVFDMDGVLADSEPVYGLCMNLVLANLGKQITPAMQRAVMGHSVEDTWAYLREQLGLEGPLDSLVALYDRELQRQLALLRDPLPGVVRVIRELQRRGLPHGVASSSWPAWIDALLGGIGLRNEFDALVSATMVEHPKPAPDLYLLAAERIGAGATDCIAIEDTPTGLKAAKAAGMFVIQVRAASTAFPPIETADLVLDSLENFDFGLLADGPA
jgi:HAD superfamily hydrolase (TIGR01509 family)